MTLKKLDEIRLLIFDLDGTLVDSEEDLALSVNVARERMMLGPLPRKTIASYVGHGVGALIRRALGEGASAEAVSEATAYFMTHYRAHMLDHTVAYPGVRESLDELRGRELAVLTNKPVRFSRDLLTGLGMASRFSFIYGGDSFAQKKPDSVGVLRLMQDTACSARATMLIGDSDIDVATGRNAGVWTCGVTYGLGAKTLETTLPDLILDDLRELPGLLGGKPFAPR